jgi:hypothetical protein
MGVSTLEIAKEALKRNSAVPNRNIFLIIVV